LIFLLALLGLGPPGCLALEEGKDLLALQQRRNDRRKAILSGY
jgi:hypothetical protein